MPEGNNDHWRGKVEQSLETIIDNQQRGSERHNYLANEIAGLKAIVNRQADRFDAHAEKVEADLDGIPGDDNRPGLKATVAELKKAKDDVSLVWRIVRRLTYVCSGAFGLLFAAGDKFPGLFSWIGSLMK